MGLSEPGMQLTKRLTAYGNPRSFGSVLRRRRSKFFRDLIDECHSRRGRVRIVDLGGTRTYWQVYDIGYLRARNATITSVNLSPAAGGARDDVFSSVVADACDLKHFADRSFDLVHSNSV